ncbi:MAG: hypothetical protein IJT83_12305, partial [Victivallales bacterium]|nr:hypothetical protein [Victivallales bacterium]
TIHFPSALKSYYGLEGLLFLHQPAVNKAFRRHSLFRLPPSQEKPNSAIFERIFRPKAATFSVSIFTLESHRFHA